MSNEIITIQDTDHYPVSGRELHEKLRIETQYTIWFKRMCEYDFEEGKDFEAINQKRLTAQGNGTLYFDHMLTLNMAKELCMLQRTEKGREVRRYLIDVENQWNSPEAIMSRALQMAQRKLEILNGNIHHLEAANDELTAKTQTMQPKADYFDKLVERGINTSFRVTAKELKVRERAFVNYLIQHKYIYKDKKGQLMPYANHVDNGLFVIKECVSEWSDWKGTQTLITPKGRATFRLLTVKIAS